MIIAAARQINDGERIFVVETGRHRVLVLEPANEAAPIVEETADTGPPVRFRPFERDNGPTVALPGYGLQALGRRGDAVGEFNFPTLIALGDGALWVGDTMNHRVQAFALDTGQPKASFGRLGDAPGEMPHLKGMTLDNGGRLWMTDAHLEQIAIYDPTGTFLIALGGPGGAPGDFSLPAGLAAHADGRVAIVDSLNRRIQIFRLQEAAP